MLAGLQSINRCVNERLLVASAVRAPGRSREAAEVHVVHYHLRDQHAHAEHIPLRSGVGLRRRGQHDAGGAIQRLAETQIKLPLRDQHVGDVEDQHVLELHVAVDHITAAVEVHQPSQDARHPVADLIDRRRRVERQPTFQRHTISVLHHQPWIARATAKPVAAHDVRVVQSHARGHHFVEVRSVPRRQVHQGLQWQPYCIAVQSVSQSVNQPAVCGRARSMAAGRRVKQRKSGGWPSRRARDANSGA